MACVDGEAGWAVAADQLVHWSMLATIYGVCAVTFMMTMYALERRGRPFVLAFAIGCVLSSVYGFWSGVWPFGVLELVWSGIALRRYLTGQAEPAFFAHDDGAGATRGDAHAAETPVLPADRNDDRHACGAR